MNRTESQWSHNPPQLAAPLYSPTDCWLQLVCGAAWDFAPSSVQAPQYGSSQVPDRPDANTYSSFYGSSRHWYAQLPPALQLWKHKIGTSYVIHWNIRCVLYMMLLATRRPARWRTGQWKGCRLLQVPKQLSLVLPCWHTGEKLPLVPLPLKFCITRYR